jgi:hypothetical protein
VELFAELVEQTLVVVGKSAAAAVVVVDAAAGEADVAAAVAVGAAVVAVEPAHMFAEHGFDEPGSGARIEEACKKEAAEMSALRPW